LAGSWMFNPSTTAIVVGLSDSILFGNLDSIKTITLNANDTLILSKNNGIIQYPDFTSNANIHLVGLHDGANSYGEYLPNFWSTYDFSVGDKFSFQTTNMIVWNFDDYSVTIEILEDLSQGLEKKFVYKMLGTGYHQIGILGPDAIISYSKHNIIDTMSYTYESLLIENQFSGITGANDPFTSQQSMYPGGVFHNNQFTPAPNAANGYQMTLPYLDTIYGNSTKTNYVSTIGDSLFYIAGLADQEVRFSNDFGRHYQSVFDFEFASSDILVGAIIQGDTTGTVLHFPEDLSTKVIHSELAIYPNPTTDKLYFNETIERVMLFNISGQIVFEEIINANLIDISHLDQGMYVLKAEQADGTSFSTKILKE